MSRIIVDEYPSEAKDCPMAKLSYLSDGAERCICKCSNGLCCISESRFEWQSEDEDVDAYNELVEEYGYSRQAFCRDHCPYLVGFKSIFEDYIGEYDTQKYTDKESYYNW